MPWTDHLDSPENMRTYDTQGINLDGMMLNDMRAFVTDVCIDSLTYTRRLFPHENETLAYAATVTLIQYARVKMQAMQLCLNGNIQSAVEAERQCEQIYNTLPAFARW